MTHRVLVATTFLSALAFHGVCVAQDDTQTDASGNAPVATSDLDAIEADYRELVCKLAADPTNPNRESAIDLALRQKYVDERFNAPIREVLGKAQQPNRWNVTQIELAHKMFPLSTLEPDERVELAFRCYLQCTDSSADRSLSRLLIRELQGSPDLTSRLVNEHLKKDRRRTALYRLAPIVGDSSDKVLLQLMEVAKSEDQEFAPWAMNLIPSLIEDLREREQAATQRAEKKRMGLDGIDSKFVSYAERIIGRYDQNGDSKLAPNEYAKMLMSPLPADQNGDKVINVKEYAIWMQSRSKR